MKEEKRKGSRGGRRTEKRLTRLVEAIREGDNFDKEKAMEQLVATADPAALRAVIPLLKEGNTAARMVALEVVKRMGHVDIGAVIGLLDDENEDVRVYGCEVLAEIREPSSVSALVRKAREDTENVRNTAVIALGEFADEEAIKALLDALNDIDWIRFSAIYSLGKTGSRQAIPALLDLFSTAEEEVSIAACEVLVDFNDEGVLHRIFKTLRGMGQAKRDLYMKIILERGNEYIFLQMQQQVGPELFDHLVNCIRYEKRNSMRMLRLLSHFRTPETCRILLGTIADMDPEGEEYKEAVMLFVALKDVWQGLIPEFLQGGEDSGLVAFIGACALAGVCIPEPTLIAAFQASSAAVKRAIVQHLTVITGGDGVGVLTQALHDEDGHVRGEAVAAVGSLGLRGFEPEVTRIARKDFFDVRIKALRSLIKLDGKGATELVEDLVFRGDGDDKKLYFTTARFLSSDTNLPLVTHLLGDGDEAVRRGAVAVVGDFATDERYARILEDLLSRETIPPEVLKVVKEKALVRFTDRLKEIFEDRDKGLWTRYYALSALGAFGDHTLFDIFIRGLNDESSLIKIGSLKAICDLRDERALPHVEPLVLSEDEDVRSTAEFVMGRLQEH